MPVEIEHKYLVDRVQWKDVLSQDQVQIMQGYLITDVDKTIRIRTTRDKGFLTIKGKTTRASRPEFEYEIPLKEAHELIYQFCSHIIEKTRHYVNYKNKLWEVDVFQGQNEGLILAEIELTSEDETYEIPEWITFNVTNDPSYANANLATRPYQRWETIL